MRLQLPQETFYEGLRSVGRAVSTKNTIPVLSGVHVEAAGQELVLRATDLELAVHKRIRARVLEAGEIVLPARYLTELVRRLPEGNLDLGVEGTRARITGQDCEYLIHGFASDQFPRLAEEPDGQTLLMEREDLRTLLREVGFAVGQDESRPYLTGVALAVAGGKAQAMATDGAVLACGKSPVENPGDLRFQVILPGRTVQELVRLLSEEEGPAVCEIAPLGNQFTFRLGDTTVTTRLLDGVYPDLLRLLPANYGSVVTVDRDRLLAACERASLVANKGAVRFQAAPDGLHVLATTPEVGTVSERVPATLQGDGFTVPLNAGYVMAGLKACSGQTVRIEFASAQSAVRFGAQGSPRSFFAVLPLLYF